VAAPCSQWIARSPVHSGIVAGRSTRSLAVMKNVDWDKLIPDLKLWNGGEGVDPVTWLNAEGNFKLAAAYSQLFWPTFSEYKGMIFAGEIDEAHIESWLTNCAGDRGKVEATLNHIHISDIHTTSDASESVERIVFLGGILKEIYAMKLAAEFPGRDIVVEFYEPPDKELNGYQLLFYQRHDS